MREFELEAAVFYSVQVGDIRLVVRRYGSGDQHILALHGLSGFSYDWKRLSLDYMAKDYSVWAVDLPGFGFSGWDSVHGYSVERMASDLLALAQALPIDSFHLIGHSFGGRVAMSAAIQDPSRFLSLTMVDIGPVSGPGDRTVKERIGSWSEEFSLFDEMIATYRSLFASESEALFIGRMQQYKVDLPNGKVRIRRDPWWKEVWAHSEPPKPADAWSVWDRLQTPTLLIRGGISDMLTSEIANTMQKHWAVRAFEEIPSVGHNVPLLAPSELWQKMSAFYSEL
jgi:pimeloyl-ACP methyl ester carboxylesterase